MACRSLRLAVCARKINRKEMRMTCFMYNYKFSCYDMLIMLRNFNCKNIA